MVTTLMHGGIQRKAVLLVKPGFPFLQALLRFCSKRSTIGYRQFPAFDALHDQFDDSVLAVSYTHLTLPTSDLV